MNCKKHGKSKFYFPTGRRPRCSKCSSDAVTRRRHGVKKKAVEYKGGKCVQCGYSKCLQAMDFHHLDPKVKEFAISVEGITRSWEKIRVELDKTILVCKNCHAEIHAGT